MSAKKSSRKRAKKKSIPVPPAHDWRTTDQDEIRRRTQRAIDEKHAISNRDPEHPVFSTFEVQSPSGMTYQVEIRDLAGCAFSCTCPDFRTAGLGTCKHVEATLIWLKRRLKGQFRLAEKSGSDRVDVVPDGTTLGIERNLDRLTPRLRDLFDLTGRLVHDADPEDALAKLRRSNKVRISQMSPHSSNPAAAPTNGSFFAATMKPASSRAAIPNTSLSTRSIHTSARACSTSPLPNAPCSPTKWDSAKPSKP